MITGTQLSILVSKMDTLVYNGAFQQWNDNGDMPLYWEADVTDPDALFQRYELSDGLALKLQNASISQQISTVSGKTYNISMTSVYSQSLSYMAVTIGVDTVLLFSNDEPVGSEARVFSGTYTASSTGTTTLTITATTLTKIIANVAMYDRDWQLTAKHIHPGNVVTIDNFTNTVEDELFTYVGDSLTMRLSNYVIDSTGIGISYFDPIELITNRNGIYRFDIQYRYHIPGATDQYLDRQIILFATGDTIKRIQNPESEIKDIIEVTMYELSSIMSMNDWYLGNLQIENADEPENRKFSWTFSPGNQLTLSEVIETATENVRSIIAGRGIPLDPDKLLTNVSANTINKKIKTAYNHIIAFESDRYVVHDAVESPTSGRFYVLCRKYQYRNESAEAALQDTYWAIFELINGSTLVGPLMFDSGRHRGFWGNKEYTSLLVEGWPDDTRGTMAFVHQYEGTLQCGENINGSQPGWPNTWEDHYQSEDTDYIGRPIEFALQWLSWGVPMAGVSIVYPDDEGALQKKTVWQYVFNERKGYVTNRLESMWTIMQNGVFVYRHGSSDIANDYYLWNYNSAETSSGSEYEFSDFDRNNVVAPQAYHCGSLIVRSHRFVTKYSINDEYPIKNKTYGKLLKELAITQDAIWYFTFDVNRHTITMNFVPRVPLVTAVGGSVDIITNKVTSRTTTPYDSLSTSLYDNDNQRTKDYIAYYNSRYGVGRDEYEIEVGGYQDNGIGDILTYGPLYLYLKEIEYLTNQVRTRMVLLDITDLVVL